jgi:hypothetical protein
MIQAPGVKSVKLFHNKFDNYFIKLGRFSALEEIVHNNETTRLKPRADPIKLFQSKFNPYFIKLDHCSELGK